MIPNGTNVPMEPLVQGGNEYQIKTSFPYDEPGIYQVGWQVLSVDGHVTNGNFRFSIKQDLIEVKPDAPVAIGGAWQVSEPNTTTDDSARTEPIVEKVVRPTKNVTVVNKQWTPKPTATSIVEPQSVAIFESTPSSMPSIESTSTTDAFVMQQETHLHDPNEHLLRTGGWRMGLWTGVILLIGYAIAWGHHGNKQLTSTGITAEKRLWMAMIGLFIILIADGYQVFHLSEQIKEPVLTLLIGSFSGLGILLRIGISWLLVLAVMAEINGYPYPRKWIVVLCLLLVASTVFNGHANPMEGTFGWFFWLTQTVHAYLAIGWVSGLMVLTLRTDSMMLEHRAIFSNVATIGMTCLLLSGIIMTMARVPFEHWSMEWANYVWVLLIKIMVVGTALWIAFRIRRRLQTASRYYMIMELGLGLLVMSISSFLAATPLPQ